MKYYIHYNGGKIYYSDQGEGDPVILLHGYLESSGIWNGFAEKLALKFRVISVDLPGHGQSTIFGECHTMEFLASMVKGLLDTLNIKKVFMTGHSLGGYVLLAFLENFPERLKGYCLFHSHPFADTPETVKKRQREIEIVRSGRKFLIYPENVTRMFANDNVTKFGDAIKRSKDIASKLSDEGIIAVLNGMMSRRSRLTVFEAGRVPCLWIFGKNDNYIQYDQVLQMVRLPDNTTVHLLENSGHMGFIEEEEKSLTVLADFILGLENSKLPH